MPRENASWFSLLWLYRHLHTYIPTYSSAQVHNAFYFHLIGHNMAIGDSKAGGQFMTHTQVLVQYYVVLFLVDPIIGMQEDYLLYKIYIHTMTHK